MFSNVQKKTHAEWRSSSSLVVTSIWSIHVNSKRDRDSGGLEADLGPLTLVWGKMLS